MRLSSDSGLATAAAEVGWIFAILIVVVLIPLLCAVARSLLKKSNLVDLVYQSEVRNGL